MRKLMIAAGLLAAGLAAGCAGTGEAAEFRSISPEKAKQMMAAPGAVVVDVREPGEYAEGHVPGAVLLPLGTIDAEHAAAVIPEKTAWFSFTAGAACAAKRRGKAGGSGVYGSI